MYNLSFSLFFLIIIIIMVNGTELMYFVTKTLFHPEFHDKYKFEISWNSALKISFKLKLGMIILLCKKFL